MTTLGYKAPEREDLEQSEEDERKHKLNNKLFSLLALTRALESDLKAEAGNNPSIENILMEYPRRFIKNINDIISELNI